MTAALFLALSAGALALYRARTPVSGGLGTSASGSLPLKIVTTQAGLTAITAHQLQAAGVDTAAIHPQQWQLRMGDQPIPLFVLGLDDITPGDAPAGWGPGPHLIFYAELTDNPYSLEQVYWLEALDLAPDGRGAEPGDTPPAALRPAITEMQATPADTANATSVVTATQRLEWHTSYNPRLSRGEDYWLGSSLFGGGELSLPFTLPGLAAGPGSLRLRLWAHTSSPEVTPDHHVQVWVNGELVGDGTHEGQGFWDVEASIHPGLLRSGSNELLLRAPGDTGARVEQDYPDWLELTYPRTLTAEDGHLQFQGSEDEYKVGGLNAGKPLLVWDVTESRAPVVQVMTDHDTGVVTPVQDHITLAFKDAIGAPEASQERPLRSYVLAQLEAIPGPTAISSPVAGDLDDLTPAEYLAIGPRPLLDALQPLLDWRQQGGMVATAVDVEAIYEQFAAGQRGPEAIQRFLEHALEWPRPPRYLLLVGDGSYDPRGYTGYQEAEQVPTCLVDTYFVGQTASDHCYADLDGDLSPELAVGRLPAQTPAQVETAVRKIIAYEQVPSDSAWLDSAVLIADDEPEFPMASDRIAMEALSSFAVEKLYLNAPESRDMAGARQRLAELMASGQAVVNYAGHGSPRWFAGDLFSTEDAAALTNAGRWPIMTAMTCLAGFFHHPSAESLSEALLWANGGAVAAFMPSSEGVTAEQLPLALSFYRHFAGGQHTTLGDAILAAKQELVEAGASTPDMIRTFNLLGDPALRIGFE